MFRSARPNPMSSLNPVLEAAMNDLTALVYDSHVSSFLRPRQLTTHFHLDGSQGTGRAACVAMFKHLKHSGVHWNTAELCDWATRRGWVERDTALLREFGSGVQSGTRFHTVPRPWSPNLMNSWLQGKSFNVTSRHNRPLKIMSCCRRVADPPPSRDEKMTRYSAPFTRK